MSASAEGGREPGGPAGGRARVVLVSSCRDEEATLESTLRAVEAQTLTPVRWVVVDDGSRDRTPAILAEAARACPGCASCAAPTAASAGSEVA